MDVVIHFVVFKKAFDSIGRETMFETLRSGGDTNENVPSWWGEDIFWSKTQIGDKFFVGVQKSKLKHSKFSTVRLLKLRYFYDSVTINYGSLASF